MDTLTRLGFTVHSKLGQGAWGEVFHVERDNLVCAAKVGALDRDFRIEALHHAQIDHPYCVPLLDYLETDTHGVILMPLLSPPPTQISEEKTIRYTWQLLGALSCLHTKEWAHQDVKLSNLLYDALEDKMMLADFGACCTIDDERRGEDIQRMIRAIMEMATNVPPWLVFLSTAYYCSYEKLYALVPMQTTPQLSPVIIGQHCGRFMLHRIEEQFHQVLGITFTEGKGDEQVWHEEFPRVVMSRKKAFATWLYVTFDHEILLKAPTRKCVDILLQDFRARVKVAWGRESARLQRNFKAPSDVYALNPRFLPCLRLNEARELLELSGLVCLLDGRYVATANPEVTVSLQDDLSVLLQGPLDRTFLRWEQVFEPGRFTKNVDKVMGWIDYIMTNEKEVLEKWCHERPKWCRHSLEKDVTHQQAVEQLLSKWLRCPIVLKFGTGLIYGPYPRIFYERGKLHFHFYTMQFKLTLLQVYKDEPGPHFKRLVEEAVKSDRRKTEGYQLWAAHEMRIMDLLFQKLNVIVSEDVLGFHCDTTLVVPEKECVYTEKRHCIPLVTFLDDPLKHIPVLPLSISSLLV